MPAASSVKSSPLRFVLAESRRSGAALAGRLWAAARRAGSGTGRFIAPVVQPITALGWLVAGSALASLALWSLLGWAEFGFVGATLLAALVIAAGFVIGRATYAVTVELEPRRVVAGARAMGRLAVTNSGARPLWPTRMELPVGSGTAEFLIPRLMPSAEHEELFAIPTNRRALIVAGPAISVRGDQLGLLRRSVAWTDRVDLFVHPKTARLAATARGLVRDLEGQTTATITDSDLAFHALRPYESGDDIRNVHWRTSARTGQLMVRQFQETRRSQLLLLQSTESAHYAGEDEFELGVSVMASIGVQVIREQTDIDVAWDGGTPRTRTPTALLDDCCRIEPSKTIHPTLREFARSAGRRIGTPSLVILVVGSLAELGAIRSVSTLYGPDTTTLAVRVEDGADPRLAKVGDVMVMTVGRLGDIAGLLDRVGR